MNMRAHSRAFPFHSVFSSSLSQIKSSLRAKEPARQADKAVVQDFLTALFSIIAAAAPVMTSCGFVVEACCRCVADFGAWVAQQVPTAPPTRPVV
jgi:hypothetical protein